MKSFFSFFRDLDGLLRGSFTRPEDLRQGRVPARFGLLCGSALLLGAIYGACMGLYALLRPVSPSVLQLLATTVKVPLLFLLTLAVTLPSLYVFSALMDSRLRSGETARLLLMGVVVNLALLASFGPVTAFFTLSTESYPFMVLLNVLFFAVAGAAGLAFVHRALLAVFAAPESTAEGGSAAPGPSAAAPRGGQGGRLLFHIWIVIYGVVGAQMGWILRPFVGAPEVQFSFFRERQSNFFEAVFLALRQLFG